MTAPVDVVRVGPEPAQTGPVPDQTAPPFLHRFTRRSSWPAWANFAVVAGITLVALSQLHPNLLLQNTTTAGGDTGAHVMLPYYMEHSLLPHGQLTGWDPAWYDGFPLYTFYFPLPAFFTVLFNAVVNYNVAFKLVTVLGTLTLPVCAWAFGKMAGLRNPGPGCLAAATLPFLFEPSFTIYGGNILSTMAGEFSYSLSISFAMLFLGVVALGLRTGRYRILAAVLFAATLLCHLIPAIFAGVGAVVWVLLDADLRRGAAPRGPQRHSPSPVGPTPVVERRGRGHRDRPHGVLAGPVCLHPGLHHQYGLDQRRGLPPPAGSRPRPGGWWCAWSSGWWP